MQKKNNSAERKKYLNKIRTTKILVVITQISILISFIALWEILANKGVIDSFITSQPSRMLETFMNLSQNGLLEHLGVTVYETLVGFLSGATLGVIIAIILWWSKFLSRVSEPFLVVLNSLPKIALRTSNNNLGRGRHLSNYCNGTGYCDGNLMATRTGEPEEPSNSMTKWISLDRQALANLFSKIKEKENIKGNIKLKLDRVPLYIPKHEFKNFGEQMIYFRKRLCYIQKQAKKQLL